MLNIYQTLIVIYFKCSILCTCLHDVWSFCRLIFFSPVVFRLNLIVANLKGISDFHDAKACKHLSLLFWLDPCKLVLVVILVVCCVRRQRGRDVLMHTESWSTVWPQLGYEYNSLQFKCTQGLSEYSFHRETVFLCLWRNAWRCTETANSQKCAKKNETWTCKCEESCVEFAQLPLLLCLYRPTRCSLCSDSVTLMWPASANWWGWWPWKR